jgi:Na+-translocating ferredoxin:NAD+ oxidoreductase RnfG subunit
VFKTIFALALIGAACGALLFVINAVTAIDIEKNRTQKARAIMSDLLKRPLAEKISWLDDISGDCEMGYFIKHTENGYSGPIRFLALYTPANSTLERPKEQLSLRVTYHQETPGIGDFIDHKRAPYLVNLDRLEPEQWGTLDNISGATITHRAIKKAASNIQTTGKYHQKKNACGK